MLNIKTLKSDIACLKRVRDNLAKYNAGEKAIAIVDGMIDGNEKTLANLKRCKSNNLADEWTAMFDGITKDVEESFPFLKGAE